MKDLIHNSPYLQNNAYAYIISEVAQRIIKRPKENKF